MTRTASYLTRPRERAPYRPYGAALAAWRSGAREVLLAGPADSGKSRMWLEKMHFCADKYPGARLLMVRKSRKSLSQSALVTYETKVLPQGWLGRLIRFNTTDQQYEYPNGSIIAIGGMDDPEKVQSSEFDLIYVQESTEITLNSWEILTKCLRNGVMPYQQICADANPTYPTHWLKTRCDRGQTLMLYAKHEDNPSITEERLATLRALTGVRRLRLYEGIWASAEGLVYEEWDPAVHLVSKQQLIDWQVFYTDGTLNRQVIRHVVAGVDWGFANPGSVTVFGVDASDSRMYLLCEVYRTRQTDDWWLEQALALHQEFGIEAFACDPSMPAYIAKFCQAGLNAVGAVNAIVPGVRALQSRLKIAADGRARFYVYADALRVRDPLRDAAHLPVCFEDEINEYVWPVAKDGVPLKEVPVDNQNHSCLIAGTMVTTDHGDVPIEQIRVGDRVLTRQGYHPVKAAGMTASSAEVITLHCSNGAMLTGTANHPVFLVGKGHTDLHAVRYDDIIETPENYIERGFLCQESILPSQKSLCITGLPIGAIPRLLTCPINAIIVPILGMWQKGSNADCIERFGKMLTDLSLMGATSIIKTVTRSTIPLKILSAFLLRNIFFTTFHNPQVKSSLHIWKRCAARRLSGTGPKWGDPGIVSMLARHGNRLNLEHLLVSTVRQHFNTRTLDRSRSIVQTCVSLLQGVSQALIMSSAFVPTALKNSVLTNMISVYAAPVPVLSVYGERESKQECSSPVTVLALTGNSCKQAVYNITVDAPVGEYFANGILVHNCDAARYACMHVGGEYMIDALDSETAQAISGFIGY